jgi:molybdate transport system substrate-binding protein
VADRVANGDAEIGIHQISEILPVPGVVLVGPLPPGIQNDTIYAGGIGVAARQPQAAQAFLRLLSSDVAAPVLSRTGMEPPPSGHVVRRR